MKAIEELLDLTAQTGIKISDVASLRIDMVDADFWLVRVGDRDTLGEPRKAFNPSHIGIKVTHPEIIDPNYLFYVFQYLWRNGYWHQYARGTTRRQNIGVGDVNRLTFQQRGS